MFAQFSRRRRALSAAAVLLALLWLLPVFAAPGRASYGCGGALLDPVNAAFEQELAALVNQERAAAGLPPLKLVAGLNDAARFHAADLGTDDYFEHDTYDRSGESLDWVCEWWQRVEGFYPQFEQLGENIAAGAVSPAQAMEIWMKSDGHRANILDPGFRELGVGYAQSSSIYQHYWVQDFSISDSYPLVIEGEAMQTSQPVVAVYLYGSFDEMRLKVDDGAWSDWLPFANQFSWTLPATRGEHTLYAEMRTSRLTTTASDSIYLDYEVTFFPTNFVYLPMTISSH